MSAIRFCLEQRLRVRLLEWLPASTSTDDVGLEECTEAISCCIRQATHEDKRSRRLTRRAVVGLNTAQKAELP
jgi:poly(3-hydroxyalkanoate) synthetase